MRKLNERGPSCLPPGLPGTNLFGIEGRVPFEVSALLFQGDGALDSYQAGVHQALAEAGLHPNFAGSRLMPCRRRPAPTR
jgi:predicted acylesterase/phospholipase RssA